MPDAIEYLSQTTLAIAPRYLGYMVSVLQGRQAAVGVRAEVALRNRRIASLQIVDGIAVVPVMGPIMHRPDLFDSFGATSPGTIRAQMGAALDDPTVEGVLMVVDSPGGEVAGIADLADALYAARGKKPMMAVADEGIHSAAYWLASAVGPVVLPRTGSVGAIGTLIAHTDMSGALDRMGVKVTVIKSGARKDLFSPFAALSADAREALQAEVNRKADYFINAVARYRNLDPDTIRGLEGAQLHGIAAVDGRLADGIDSVEGAFLAFRMALTGSSSARGAALASISGSGSTLPQGAVSGTYDNGESREGAETMDHPQDRPNPAIAAVQQATAGAAGVSAGPLAPPTPTAPAAAPAAPAATPWAGATNVVSIETARRQAKDEAQAAERSRAAEIMHWCAFAGKADLAEGYIGSAMSIEQVRNDLLSQTAGASFELQTQHGGGGVLGGMRRFDSVDEIFARRKQAIAEAKQARRYF